MKFCKDCKHSVLPHLLTNSYVTFMCGRSDAPRSLVTGDLTVSCMDTRREGAECGPDGDLFEERPPAPEQPRIETEDPSRAAGFWEAFIGNIFG